MPMRIASEDVGSQEEVIVVSYIVWVWENGKCLYRECYF
jgi:hypothetical protein